MAAGDNARRLVRLLHEEPDEYCLDEIKDLIGASYSYTHALLTEFGGAGDLKAAPGGGRRRVPVWHLAPPVREIEVKSLAEMIEAMEPGWELLFMVSGNNWALLDFVTPKGRLRVRVNGVMLDTT